MVVFDEVAEGFVSTLRAGFFADLGADAGAVLGVAAGLGAAGAAGLGFGFWAAFAKGDFRTGAAAGALLALLAETGAFFAAAGADEALVAVGLPLFCFSATLSLSFPFPLNNRSDSFFLNGDFGDVMGLPGVASSSESRAASSIAESFKSADKSSAIESRAELSS